MVHLLSPSGLTRQMTFGTKSSMEAEEQKRRSCARLARPRDRQLVLLVHPRRQPCFGRIPWQSSGRPVQMALFGSIINDYIAEKVYVDKQTYIDRAEEMEKWAWT